MSYKSHIDQEAKEHEAVERWRKDLLAKQKMQEANKGEGKDEKKDEKKK